MRSILIVILGVAACGGGTPPPKHANEPTAAPSGSAGAAAAGRPAAVTDEMVASTDRVVATLTKLAADVDAAADCKAATAAIRGDQDAMRAIVADADGMEKAWSTAGAEAQRWFDVTYRPRLADANEKVMRKEQACDDDPDFKAALQAVNSQP